MKRANVERNMVVVLFLMVLITFSMAQRDTNKIAHLYTSTPLKAEKWAFTKSTSEKQPLQAQQNKQ